MTPFDLPRALADAADGATLEVPEGTWAGGLVITRSLTLRARGRAAFDGLEQGPVLRVEAPGAQVVLEGFVFRNATTLAGAGVFHGDGALVLRDCRFEGCAAPGHGGGAVYSRGERLVLERCRFEGNEGRQGGAVLLDQEVDATVLDCLFTGNRAVRGAALRVKEAAVARLSGCTLAGNVLLGPPPRGASLEVAPTLTRAPRLELSDCVWSEPEGAGPPGPLALVQAVRCVLPVHVALEGGNRCEEARFAGEGPEPWRLLAGSAGTALAVSWPEGRRDLLGRARDAAAGAFSAT